MLVDGKSICLNVGFGPLAPIPQETANLMLLQGLWCEGAVASCMMIMILTLQCMNIWMNLMCIFGTQPPFLFAWVLFHIQLPMMKCSWHMFVNFRAGKTWVPWSIKYIYIFRYIWCWTQIDFLFFPLTRTPQSMLWPAGSSGRHGPSRLSCPFAAQIKEAGGTVKQLKS